MDASQARMPERPGTPPTAHVPEATADERSRMRRYVRSPLGWLLVGVVVIGAISSLMTAGKSGSATEAVLSLVAAAAAIPAYRAVMRRLARRETPEIAFRGAGREVLLGAAVGAGYGAAEPTRPSGTASGPGWRSPGNAPASHANCTTW